MTDNTRAKSHLKDAERKLNDLSNISEINRITAARSLDLFSTLSSGNNLFVDDEVRTDIINVRDRLSNIGTDASSEITRLTAESTRLAAIRPLDPTITARITEIGREIAKLNRITGTAGSNVANRLTEYTQLNTYAGYFNTGTDINNTTVDLSTTPGTRGLTPQTLDTLFKNGVAPNPEYSLCDEQGNPITKSGSDYKLQIGGQTVTLSGINLSTGNLDFNNLTITPSNIDIDETLKLSINAKYPASAVGVSNINLVCNKKFELSLNQGKLDQAGRETQLALYNGTTHVIENSMNSLRTTQSKKLEKESIFAALKYLDGPKFDKLNDQQKEDLYKKIQKNIVSIFATGGSWAQKYLNHVNNYTTADINNQNFKERIIDDKHAFSKDPKINKNATAWRNNLHNTLEDQIIEYFKHRFNRAYTDDTDGNTFVKTQLTEYLTELEENKLDSDVNQRADSDLSGIEMESKAWLGKFGRKDKNYMAFFSGSSIDIGEQTINIDKEIKYSMNLKVSGKNEIVATVKIGNKKELIKKGGDPMKLIKSILGEKEIPEGKTRLHIAYNIIAGMIQMAKKEDISLSFQDPSTRTNRIIKMDGKNIILENQDDSDPYKRKTDVLFDYGLFENTNSWEDPNTAGRHTPAPDNRALRGGLEKLTRHFNYAMNETYKYYGEATQRKFGLLRSDSVTDFPTSAWTSPIKKLLNCKTNTDFDFSTSVSHNGKSVQIERQKNTFILTIDGVEVKGKDLGKLLKKRKGGVRLFDGVERAICGEIYKNMVEKLRTNTKIARSSFGVMDPKTGRMYILDEDGQLGYLRAEEAGVEEANLHRRPGVSTAANVALAGGLGAAGVATGGAAALAAGLTWGAAGTAASWGAMTAPGVAVFKDIRRIAGKGYGTLDHVPAARTMCDEAETREIYKDPFLMGKLMKVMNLRLGQL